jgi:cytochrome P450
MSTTLPGSGYHAAQDGFDPRSFDHHDPVQMGPEHRRIYEQLRARCPVARSDRHGGFWVVPSYDDCVSAAQDWRGLSSARGVTLPKMSGPMAFIPIEIDPPDHTRYRRLLLPYFSPGAMALLEDDLRAYTAAAVERLIERGEGDLVSDLASLVPMYAICRLLGVPNEDQEQLREWGVALAHGPTASGDDLDGALEAATNLLVYLAEMIQERRAQPEVGDDLVSLLCRSEEPLEDDELLSIIFLLLPAGFDTTEAGIGGMLVSLAQHQHQQDLLAGDPGRIPDAVEELLRYVSPVQAVHRTATADYEIHGQRIAEGESVILLFGSANRDASEFRDPETIDFEREQNRHLAFGVGVHRCLGSNLARLELRIVLEELLSRARFGLSIPESELRWIPGHIRGLESLPVRLHRRSGADGGSWLVAARE